MLIPATACLITRDSAYPPDAFPPRVFAEIVIQTSSPHVLRRYELAAKAYQDIIYFQDDDCRIDVETLWQQYDGTLTHAITYGHRKIYYGTGVTLVGWGSFFPKSMVMKFLDQEAELRRFFGDRIFEEETDRLFTYLNRPHKSIIMPIQQFNRPVKMSARPDHYQRKDWVINRLKEWR